MKTVYLSSFSHKNGGAELSFNSKYKLEDKNAIISNQFDLPILGESLYLFSQSYFLSAFFSPFLRYKKLDLDADQYCANGLDCIALVNTLTKKNVKNKRVVLHVRSELELFRISYLCSDKIYKKVIKFVARLILKLNEKIYRKKLFRLSKKSNLQVVFNSEYSENLGHSIYSGIESLIETPLEISRINYTNVNVGINAFHCVGWRKNKGSDIIRALALSFPNKKFFIYGHELISTGVEFPNIVFVGFINDWIEKLSARDLVLVPSLVPETFSRVTAEALIQNKQILASSIGNIPYLLKEYPNRLVLNPCDIREWIEKILHLDECSLHN